MMNEKAEPTKEFLNAQKSAAELMNLYKTDETQKGFNLLLLGEAGTGKSTLLKTARKPILIDSFDRGGTKGFQKEILSGDVIVDSRWEKDIPKRPDVFPKWLAEMERRLKAGFFNHIGTYAIDSSTSWAKTIMNDILKKAGIPGQAPRFTHDYTPQKTAIDNSLHECLNLPCDFILTGHLEPHKDEVTKSLTFRYATTGKGVFIIPTLFDEMWIMEPKETSSNTEYRILTQSTGRYQARSRLAARGKIEKYEKADIKNILKKVGMSYADKPKLT